MDRDDVLRAINDERNRQDEYWGTPQHHTRDEWMVILMEEVGEAAQALLQKEFTDYRAEITQVAAVAAAMLEFDDDTLGS